MSMWQGPSWPCFLFIEPEIILGAKIAHIKHAGWKYGRKVRYLEIKKEPKITSKSLFLFLVAGAGFEPTTFGL